jgi:quercetin dioxygenase-like cupin family protein
MLKTILIKGCEGDFKANPAHIKVEIKPIVDTNLSQNIKTLVVKVLAQGEIKPHTHDTLEVFHIMQGNGEVLVNDEYQSFTTGDTIYAPAGIIHGLKNTGDQEVLLLANFPNYKS